jgi:hypothetical protein
LLQDKIDSGDKRLMPAPRVRDLIVSLLEMFFMVN